MAKKYPGWSPYNYVQDNPISLVDQTGMDPESGGDQQWQYGFNGPTWFSTGSSDETHVPLTLAPQGGSNPTSISANGFGKVSPGSDYTGSVLASMATAAEYSDYVNGAADILHTILPAASDISMISGKLGDLMEPLGPANLAFQVAPSLYEYSQGKISTGRAAYDILNPSVAYGVGLAAESAGTGVLAGAFLWEVGKAYQYLHENVPQWLNSLDQHFLSLPEKLEGGGYGPNN
jgi:hypothetical protein